MLFHVDPIRHDWPQCCSRNFNFSSFRSRKSSAMRPIPQSGPFYSDSIFHTFGNDCHAVCREYFKRDRLRCWSESTHADSGEISATSHLLLRTVRFVQALAGLYENYNGTYGCYVHFDHTASAPMHVFHDLPWHGHHWPSHCDFNQRFYNMVSSHCPWLLLRGNQ